MLANILRLITYILIAFFVFIPNREIMRVLGLKNLNDGQAYECNDDYNPKTNIYNENDELKNEGPAIKVEIRRTPPEEELIEEKILDELVKERVKLISSRSYKYEFKEVIPKKELIDVALLERIAYDIKVNEYIDIELSDDDKIILGDSTDYNEVDGITCFRGNNHRDSASFGTAEIQETKLEIIWYETIGRIDQWSGVGWNGQPAIVQWDETILKSMNIKDEKKNKVGLKEVIYGALDGKVYFLDLEDGLYTRDPITIPGPIKGSVALDPRGIPLLYVGQGINKVNGQRVEIGYRIYSLINQEKLYFINGVDSYAYRGWGAFDSTPIIDKKTDTMMICGENGIFYRIKLNTDYDSEKNFISLDPEIIKYRYKIQDNKYQGIENSLAVYRNLGYFADNGGWLQCIDLNTLTPVWIRNVTDDTDSTIVIEEEDKNRVSLYTACEVDKQGPIGKCYIRKIDAITGQLLWEKDYECQSKLGNRPNNGGALATPLLGKNNMDGLIIFNLARWGGFSKGKLVALEKETGEEKWSLNMNNYSWSSPVDIYTNDGTGYIVVCNSAGKMLLLEGSTGKVLDEINLGANVEGSPAVFNNIIVVGTRGQRIYGVKVK